MENKLSITFLIILSIILFPIIYSPVQGQTGPGLPSQTWHCLKWKIYKGDVKPGGINHHRATLTGDGFPINQDIYIVSCVDTAEGLKCTTGNNDYDLRLGFGENNYTSLQNSTTLPLPFGFVVDGGSKRTLPEGKLEVIAASYTRTSTDHSFYGVTINEAETREGRGASLQYGTFKFKQDTDKCTAVRWDPYGRIFDSQSLEPLSNVKISILNNNKDRVPIPNNPQTTQADGSFNFLVEPGTYYLLPEIPSGYSFLAQPNLHPNYIKAYFDIYKPDEIIIEKAGQPKHRDIPFDPAGNPPFRGEPTLITYGHLRLETQTKYEGKISHPLSIIALIGETNNQEIAKATADKFGFWEIKLESKEIPQNEGLTPKISKVDLTSNQTGAFLPTIFSKLFKKVFAQPWQTASKKVVFQPLLSYVEGYAYDDKDNPIPKAKVNVKLKMSNSVYYQTTADENGYFAIPPEDLPIFEYYLEFKAPNSAASVKRETSQFAEKNTQYLAANRINLMTATKKNIAVSSVTTQGKPPAQHTPLQTEAVTPSSTEKLKGENRGLLFFLFLVVGLLGMGATMFFYFKKVKPPPTTII